MENKTNQSISTYLKGKQKEGVAKDFLEKKGFLILKENFRCRVGEIDLIAMDHGKGQTPVLVFVEVRSSTDANALLKFSIGKEKRVRLRKTAHLFILLQKIRKVAFRFDVIWVYGKQIEHWTNIEI